jgi:hypothetical protein
MYSSLVYDTTAFVELNVTMANVFEIKKITATPSSSMFVDIRSFGPYLPSNISNKKCR